MQAYKYLIVLAVAWLVSQGMHVVTKAVKSKKFSFSYFLETGGMPSSHTAIITSVTAAIGLSQGASSPLFALALAVSAIVMIDIKVRWSVGQQAEALNILIKDSGSKLKPVKVVRGHRPIEVLVGAIVGVFIALVVYYCTQNA